MDFSVIIPAHNEEEYIGKCLQSIREAEKHIQPASLEIIVVCNRCTDSTALISEQYGARVLVNDEKNLSAIRNTGILAAEGEIIVTIDADSVMTEFALSEIRQMLESGKYIGGGANPRFERMSVGIFFSAVYVALNLIPTMIRNRAALSGAIFWFYKKDFVGFDERLVSLEDMDFAVRMHRVGQDRGQRFGTLKKSYIVTSSRKFDEFGDWYLIRNRKLTKRIFTGADVDAAYAFYYDVRE